MFLYFPLTSDKHFKIIAESSMGFIWIRGLSYIYILKNHYCHYLLHVIPLDRLVHFELYSSIMHAQYMLLFDCFHLIEP